MKKDYSEYVPTDYEKYYALRYNHSDVKINLFYNHATVIPNEKRIRLEVNGDFEELTIKDEIDEFSEFEKAKFNVRDEIHSPEEEQEYEENRQADIRKNNEYFSKLTKKYTINKSHFEHRLCNAYKYYKVKNEIPLNNVLSGAVIDIRYGEGILDFIYTDFDTPFKQAIQMPLMMEAFAEEYHKNNPAETEIKQTAHKVYNENQLIIEEYFDFRSTLIYVKGIMYSSLYTAICPPMFRQQRIASRPLKQYYLYLKNLQKEFLELIEFCFDDEFYPTVLGHLVPSERFYLFRDLHEYCQTIGRSETFRMRRNSMGGNKMPYGMEAEELVKRFSMEIDETEEHRKFAERYGLDVSDLITRIKLPTFINVSYEFSSVHEILELELTKMLEIDMRFRKCKRCGRYFIMKGNYDTKFCDRVAEGETRSCQELAALDKYKQKVADNAALPIYNKYYKRYAARVKVRQIKEDEFRKWKYAAIIKRDECTNGNISVDEFVEWLEGCFPNRGRK